MNPLILAAIVAPLLYAVINFLDKYMVSKVATSKSAWVFSGFFSGLVGLIVLLVLVILKQEILLPAKEAGLLFIAGVFQIAWLYFYFKALEKEDTSTVTPLFQFIGVFTYIFGVIFLGEVLVLGKLFAVGLILFGGGLLFYDPSKKLSFKKEAWYMILATFILSLSLVLFKKSLPEIESLDSVGILKFSTSTMYMFIGMFSATFFVFTSSKSFFDEFKVMWKQNSKKVWKVVTLTEIFNILATLTVVYATLSIEVVKVTALESMQAFYVLLIGILGTKYLPKYISEDKLSKKSLSIKILAILIIIAGGFLLA